MVRAMNDTAKKTLAIGALGLAIVGGSLTMAATGVVGPAGAQTPTAEAMLTSPDGGADDPGRGWFNRFRQHRREIRRHVAQLTADTIGISRDELRRELAAGASVAQVASAHGVDPQTVVDAIVTDADGRVDQAVADAKIDEQQAARIKDRLPGAVTRLVDHVFGGDG
jgi:hypothetical protein